MLSDEVERIGPRDRYTGSCRMLFLPDQKGDCSEYRAIVSGQKSWSMIRTLYYQQLLAVLNTPWQAHMCQRLL
jgi:hypothetical protein